MKFKSIFHSLSLAVFCLMVFGGTALGDTLNPWNPLLIGTTDDLSVDQSQAHQDTLSNVNWLVDNYTPAPGLSDSFSLPENLTLLGKYESGDYGGGDWVDTVWGNNSPYFNVASYGTQGFWSKTAQAPAESIYFSVKASNAFALYYADDLTWSYWNTFWTAGNKNKHNQTNYNAMSHISFWTAAGADTPGPSPDPVPEPSTILLVGIGVLGMARAGRKYIC